MTKESESGENAICISPSNIIRRQLSKHEAEVLCYKERRPEGVLVVAALKAEEYPDLLSIRAAQERLVIWDTVIRRFELLCWFADKLDAAEYSGERYSFLQLVKMFSGRDYSNPDWRDSFRYFGIDAHEKVWFPVRCGSLDIVAIENKLVALVREDGTVAACEVPPALEISANSKVYREVKRKLEGRDWTWKQRKIGGKVEKIVIPPR
jgi:hypothetical protein